MLYNYLLLQLIIITDFIISKSKSVDSNFSYQVITHVRRLLGNNFKFFSA